MLKFKKARKNTSVALLDDILNFFSLSTLLIPTPGCREQGDRKKIAMSFQIAFKDHCN